MGLACPVCKSKELEPYSIGNDTFDKCPECHGLWFTGDEIGDFEELPESEILNDFQDQLDGASIGDTRPAVKGRLCPSCQEPMNSYQYDVSSGIWISGCPDGHGIWLDKGEILKIHKHLQDTAKQLTPERKKALVAQLKKIDSEERASEEEALMSIFGSHSGSKAPVPLWHFMDGVSRFLYHALFKLGV